MRERSTRNMLGMLCLGLWLAPGSVCAQSYPNRTVRIVAPFSPGGPVDSLARLVSGRLTGLWGQQVVVDNRAGGNTVIGTELVARAAPDGYTLLLNSTGIAVNATLYAKLPYDTVRDLLPIATLAAGPGVLVVHPALPVHSLKALIALAKAQPGALAYASSGSGTLGHLTMEMLKKQAGIQLTHIPYRGVAPALIDVIAGHVPMAATNISAIMGHSKTGRVRVLAVSAAQRWPSLPQVPTFAEVALPGFEATNWYAMFAPANTPAAIVAKINTDVGAIMRLANIRETLDAAGIGPISMTPEETSAYFRAEIAKWGKAVQASGAKAD